MLYKYSVILDINPMAESYDDVMGRINNAVSRYNPTCSSLEELSIKEQLKYYIDKNIPYDKDKDRMFELIDKL